LNKLGKYEVLGELGRGAMGVVYRARDPIINRLVALKTITTGVADDPGLLQRFYREAQSAGGLQHPNIVTIYDMGEAGATPYIAMELVEGENLEQLISRRPNLPLAVKLVYAMQACRAFDFAHKRGIVHRDIKPGNVMVSKDGTIKVVDFGIARVLETSRTQTGMLIGTFAYMSPEQYHGEHADERSDIWSFGVLLYELLCYKRPFAGPTPASLMQCICNEEPALLGKSVPDCPKELELTVAKMLRKSGAERYQSMEDVLLDLDPICKSLQAQSVADFLTQGRQLIEQGSFSEARELVRQALQVDASNPQARALLEKANAELKRSLNRPKAQQFVEKGEGFLREGKLQEAKLAAENALQLDSRFAPAAELQRSVQKALDRNRMLAEWLEAAKQSLAEGMPEEAEGLLQRVLQEDPSNAQAQSLQQQALKETAERERGLRIRAGLQQARELWTRQNYPDCVKLLEDLDREFPGEEQISRLLETVREDQLEQQKQDDLLQSRKLVASGNHDEAIALLSRLQKQFPGDEEIPAVLEEVRKDQLDQQRLRGLNEARSLMAAGRYDECASLLISLRKTFPEEEEIPRLLESARLNKAEQTRLRGFTEAGKLLADRQYEQCAAFLATLEKQFPGDEEILALQKTVREDQARQQKQQRLEEVRGLLSARRYDECSRLLTRLEKQFPGDDEILRLRRALGEDRAKQRKLQSLAEARNLLASKSYQKSVELLTSLQKEFPEDDEIRRLLEATQKEQADQRRKESLGKARDLLAARQFEESIAFLTRLQTEFPGESAIAKLLESARKEQAEHRQREGMTKARSLLAARQYEETIALLTKLKADSPGEAEIARLLTTAREDFAEQTKQEKLAQVRSLLAAESFGEALSVLDSLAVAHPKDSAVSKMRLLVQSEQEKRAKAEKLQRELDALKKLMGEKKYPEVMARAKELLIEFPSDATLTRLAELAASRQASIEKELLFKKTIDEAKALFDAGRFDDAVRGAQNGLKLFPGNAELQALYERAEVQQRKLLVRRQMEQRIREIRVKINRAELSDAVNLAEQTLVTLGPDTDVSHLLKSAQAELQAREKKRTQDQMLETARTLLESGAIDAAGRTIDDALKSNTIDPFDPRAQRLAEQIKEAKAPPSVDTPKSGSPAPPALSKEYAFLQAPPLPEAPPSEEKTAPQDSVTATGQISASQPAVPYFAPSKPEEPSPVVVPEPPVVPIADSPRTEVKPTELSRTPLAVPDQIQTRPQPVVTAIPAKVSPLPKPVAVPLWRKPLVLTVMALALVAVLGIALRSRIGRTGPDSPVVKVSPQAAQPPVNPLETQQQQAIDEADRKIAANDLEGAIQQLRQAAALNGPLTKEIQLKLSQLEESQKDATLRQLRRSEEVSWQDAKRLAAAGKYTEAERELKRITVLPTGGVHKDEAQQYLDKTIPRLKQQNNLLRQAQASLKQGDFASARRSADLLKQNGGNPVEIIASIDQAELAQLKQLENQFDQWKQRDDEGATQQLKALQPRFQALAADGGPQSAEAQSYANNIPAAIADMQARGEKKRADIAFQQIEQRYQQAVASNDKNGLAAARGDFQSIVQNGGPHADQAKQYVADIDRKLVSLNAPPSQPPVVPTKPAANPDVPAAAGGNVDATEEKAILAALDQFNLAFAHGRPREVMAIWPKVDRKYLDAMTASGFSFTMVLKPVGPIVIRNGTAVVPCNLLSKTKGMGQNKENTKAVNVTLQKTGGRWLISDAAGGANPQ